MSQPSANPTYKLYYFNVKALAESIRILFAYGGIDYEDIRIAKEDWPALKPSMIFQTINTFWFCLNEKNQIDLINWAFMFVIFSHANGSNARLRS